MEQPKEPMQLELKFDDQYAKAAQAETKRSVKALLKELARLGISTELTNRVMTQLARENEDIKLCAD